MFDKGKHFINKEVMMKNLIEIKSVYDKHYIPFFFIFGTLLGAMREKDFIAYDNDVDLGAYWEDRDRILEANKEIAKLGYKIETEISPYDINYIKNNEKIEIWLFEEIKGLRCYDNKRCARVKYVSSFLDILSIIDFKGYKFKAPSNPKSFLEVTYGQKWTIPNENGSYIL